MIDASNHRELELHRAVCADDLKGVDALLRAGVDPNWVPPANLRDDRLPLLHEAAYLGSLRIMRRLVAAGANVNLDACHHTPLTVAALANQVEAGQWLLRNGADQPDRSHFQYAPLTKALEHSNLAFAEMLLQDCPTLDQAHVNYAAQAIMGYYNVKVTQWLLEKNVPTTLTTLDLFPWLHMVQYAKPNDALILVQLLIKAGADVNLVDMFSGTPLHEAVKADRPNIMMALLQAGADPDLADEQGKTARLLIQEASNEDLRATFRAWETSKAAHHIISTAPTPTDLKPL